MTMGGSRGGAITRGGSGGQPVNSRLVSQSSAVSSEEDGLLPVTAPELTAGTSLDISGLSKKSNSGIGVLIQKESSHEFDGGSVFLRIISSWRVANNSSTAAGSAGVRILLQISGAFLREDQLVEADFEPNSVWLMRLRHDRARVEPNLTFAGFGAGGDRKQLAMRASLASPGPGGTSTASTILDIGMDLIQDMRDIDLVTQLVGVDDRIITDANRRFQNVLAITPGGGVATAELESIGEPIVSAFTLNV